ncbi:Pfs, NACHT and ankyrin domain protein [Plectosphaerella plurivora]|uniref:Pfs, NACHT and ankyrin domain protein n=1 Tax=Plectosphaerella plurivora TaxID=936078 RepID=A0A9P8VCS5_9PEZI|nr:Pfs, NACHT and ankyrin domain protein [Plectosphaerella plurivora]
MSDPKTYTIGWIAAIHEEYVAARQRQYTYTLGRIGRHNIVMASLPNSNYGLTSATTVAKDMLHSFPNIRVSLMVGIAGGAPFARNDVRLGDIVVSSRAGGHGGVFQYDYGKTIQGDDFQFTQSLNQPPTLLLTAVSKLRARFAEDGPELNMKVKKVLDKKPRLRKAFSRPPATSDRLYKSNFVHSATSDRSCCENHKDGDSTASAHLMVRSKRGEEDDNPAVHYGLIASANQLMKDALFRDALAAEKGVLCFEMESAGLMNNLPCLVVRGICDYSDSHKNKEWQGYAAMVAAAYARDLILQIHPSTFEAEKPILETLRQVENKLEDMFQATTDVNKVVHGVKSDQHIRRMEEWLQPPLPSPNVLAARQVCQKGTGAWLLAHPTLKAWESGLTRHLWLHGQPGFGKTVLSTTLLDHLQADPERVVISFFFDFNNDKNRFVDADKPETTHMSVLDASFDAHDKGRRQPITDTLKDVVKKMLTQRKVSIILDALDESLKSDDLISWLTDVISNPNLKGVQSICTSRPEEYFRKTMPSVIGESNCICLDKPVIDGDIALFVSAQLAKRKGFQRLPRELIERIQRKDVRTALESLPKDLDETYRKILDRVSPARKYATIRLLQFLAHSDRPPSAEEAKDIIATDTDVEPACFDIDGRPFLDDDVQLYGLGLYRNKTMRKEVRLAHFSVREFLVQQHAYNLPRASIAITKMCLASYEVIQRSPELWTRFGAMAETDEAVFRAIMKLLDDEETFQLWGRLYQPDRADVNATCGQYGNALQAASVQGHVEAVKLLLRKKANVNATGGQFGNALQAASYSGHRELVALLLREGAAVNAQGGSHDNALGAAMSREHVEIAKLLVSKGASIDAPSTEWGNSLQAASSAGCTELVEYFLECGANVNARGGFLGSVLQAAAHGGHAEIVKLLLQNGADVNAQGGYFGSALQAAADRDHAEIVQLLLKNKADANAQGGYFGSALAASAAAIAAHFKLVGFLSLEYRSGSATAGGGQLEDALKVAV